MKWININDKKPNHGQIVVCKTPDVWCPFVARFYKNGAFAAIHSHLEAQSFYEYASSEIINDYDLFSITHWLPMPDF